MSLVELKLVTGRLRVVAALLPAGTLNDVEALPVEPP
jgi:hypothetical protein